MGRWSRRAVRSGNLFFASTLADIHLRPNWGGGYESGTPYTLAQFQSQFGREIASIAADPQLVDPPADYHLQASSPARGNGDPTYWPSHAQVDRGAYPFADLLFADGFDATD